MARMVFRGKFFHPCPSVPSVVHAPRHPWNLAEVSTKQPCLSGWLPKEFGVPLSAVFSACRELWQEATRARIGWNGRPARCFRRLAGSISRNEPERGIARRGCRHGGRCPTRAASANGRPARSTRRAPSPPPPAPAFGSPFPTQKCMTGSSLPPSALDVRHKLRQ